MSVLLCGLFLSSCGSADNQGIQSSAEPVVYANYIQKNNRTVRVKNFDEVLPDSNSQYPSDTYIRFGLFYDTYATPDEIIHQEFVFEDKNYSSSIHESCKYIFPATAPSMQMKFNRYVFESIVDLQNIEGYVSLESTTIYDNVFRFTYRCNGETYWLIVTQTKEDIAKGDDVWSSYLGQYTSVEKE